jgi:hypothetical protein
MIHELKSWPTFFEAIRRTIKRHELRRNDRDYRVGDILKLREYDPENDTYTGREQVATVTYITSVDSPCAFSEQGLQPGFCILSIHVTL